MFRKNIYRWHRVTSLIIALPVLLWAISGFMHPVMTTFRPKLGTQFMSPQPIDSSQLKVPLKEALLKNNIDTFSNFRIVQMSGYWFYQVQLPGQSILRYISTQTGMPLRKGDQLYARLLARQFLTGKTKAADTIALEGVHDCCKNAATAVMKDTAGAKISGVELVEQFNSEYKYINRLLPVYKVSFGREDGIRIYVETQQDKFVFAMNDTRAFCDTFFSLFHTWSWLEFLGKGKLVVEMTFTLLAFLTTLMGIFIFFSTKTKKSNGNAVVTARRNHRWVSIIVSLFTLMFTFSGCYHAFSKFKPDTRDKYYVSNSFTPVAADLNYTRLQTTIGEGKAIMNISLVQLNDSNYWQVSVKSNDQLNPAETASDLMKNKPLPAPNTVYINTVDYSVLVNGESKYAHYLANMFSRRKEEEILQTEVITKFAGEYGFVNKRLPVWKVSYAENHNERLYVETSTGKLAAIINDIDLIDGYSFALLHKHEFMAWAGKPVKDFSTMFWALAQVAMIITGLTLYLRCRKKRSRT